MGTVNTIECMATLTNIVLTGSLYSFYRFTADRVRTLLVWVQFKLQRRCCPRTWCSLLLDGMICLTVFGRRYLSKDVFCDLLDVPEEIMRYEQWLRRLIKDILYVFIANHLTSKEMEVTHPVKNTYLYAMILIFILKSKFLIQENHKSDQTVLLKSRSHLIPLVSHSLFLVDIK